MMEPEKQIRCTDSRIPRRSFHLVSSALLSGLVLPAGQSLAEQQALANKRLVELGLNALARAAEMNYFADGHRGAALISAHLMCVDNGFDEATTGLIVDLFDQSWAPSKLCEPFPEADPIDDASERIGKALAEGNGVLREVGHDAIFAMHAIKAFRMMPETASRQRVDGVCNLIRAFKPWRDDPPNDDVDPPPFTDQQAASRFILKEASDAIDRFVGFGQGFAGHMMTFGQSLVELAAMGDVEWAESCRLAFRKYVTVTRKGPQPTDRRIKDHAKSEMRPDEARYWQHHSKQTLGIGHVFKYPYAYYDLLNRASDPELEREFEAKAWHVF